MKITVNVTQGDIERGERGRCTSCPIAHAVKRAASADYVAVDDESIDVKANGNGFTTFTPKEAIRFITRFDDGFDVEPFSFDLELN